MALAKYNQAYFFSSDPAAGTGAVNVSPDGSAFTVQLNDGIEVPAGAVACEVGVSTGAIWATTPNIGPGLGAGGADDNKFSYTTGGLDFFVTVPTGQYQLPAITSYLATQFLANGHAANIFTLGGQDATGLAYVTFLNAGDTVHFEQVGTIGSILGFPAAAITSTVPSETVYGTTQAQLDTVNTLIRTGIPTNAATTGLIGVVPVTARPGRLINYTAISILWIPAPELVGTNRTRFAVRLTNERGEPTPTANESWSFTLMIRYRK